MKNLCFTFSSQVHCEFQLLCMSKLGCKAFDYDNNKRKIDKLEKTERKMGRKNGSHKNWPLQRLYKLFMHTFTPDFLNSFFKLDNIIYEYHPQRKNTNESIGT